MNPKQTRCNEDGLGESAHAEARRRNVAGAVIPTPCEGRWSRCPLRDGMRIPLEGGLAWMLPKVPKTCRRGRITGLDDESAQ